MTGKVNISPNDTLVLDDDELGDLDELTFTTIIGDAAKHVEAESPNPMENESDLNDDTFISLQGDPEIDELLNDLTPTDSEPAPRQEYSFFEDMDEDESDLDATLDELLSPELLFPDEPLDPTDDS